MLQNFNVANSKLKFVSKMEQSCKFIHPFTVDALNVITVNVIIRLMLSVFQIPAHFNQIGRKISVYCYQIDTKIRLMLSVFHLIQKKDPFVLDILFDSLLESVL